MKNVLLQPLEVCCSSPETGYFRDGYCRTDERDEGRHVICAQVTEDFLVFTRERGNDLSTPRPEFGFPGLRPGDRWCLCALRWKEAWLEGVAPPVMIAACQYSALEVISLEVLRENAVDLM